MKPKSSSTSRKTTEIKPQPGPQEQFLSSSADVVFYGGAAGGGKSFGILLEPLRHIKTVEGFGAVIFRRTYPEVKNEGGLWDTSAKIYLPAKGKPRETDLLWEFPPYGNHIKFAHMEYEKNKYAWQGAQIPLIEFDELTHFSESQFFYLLSRNRSVCGVKPCMRATCNPDADSWVAEFIKWYINDDGYIDDEKSGLIRWFIRVDDEVVWGSTREELLQMDPESEPTSFTFIKARLEDNKILMKEDPTYKAKLKALSLVEKERLLYGNWKIKPAAGNYFRREWYEIVDKAPPCDKYLRWWDCAATEQTDSNDPDWSIGLLMGELKGVFYVIDVQRFRKSPGDSDAHMEQQAIIDGKEVLIREEQEPGSSGKKMISVHSRGIFKGYKYAGVPSSGDKVTRATPFSAASQNGNVKLVRAHWNNEYLGELEGFPERKHDDQVDASSGAFNELTSKHTIGDISGLVKTRPR